MRTIVISVAVLAFNGRRRSGSELRRRSRGPNNPAVNTTGTNNANNPVAGANSFTEGQAKSRMETGGYSNVSGLKKDDKASGAPRR